MDLSFCLRRSRLATTPLARGGCSRSLGLRDTFASQLLTVGVQLGYVSAQLGHADLGTTATHYAKWCGDGEYRDPMVRREGEVPADFLARLESPPRVRPPTRRHLTISWTSWRAD